MPPKRKATGGGARGGKKAKTTEAATLKDAAAALKAEDKKHTGKKTHKVDDNCPLKNGKVVDDYDCMLNQTNIGQNNNKYYVIQVIQNQTDHYSWNRWGRVGESGQNSLNGPMSKAEAIKDFEKKFRSKTRNKWSDRASFKPAPGKYTLIDMADDDETDAPVAVSKKPTAKAGTSGQKVAASKLDKATQALMKLIFDNDMFNETLKDFDIDVEKMPLGKLSKGQIAKGFEVLDELEAELKAKRKTKLNELSSRFYTAIPHDFGRMIPPLINNEKRLRKKMDMLLVLGDIELVQRLQKEKEKKATAKGGGAVPHPFDVNYDLLNCTLSVLPKTSEEYKVIQKYTDQTAWNRNPKIKEVWKVDRHGEGDRFAAHDSITNRKLLWHGTSMAVIAAILKNGLRIMPHSGGCVGAGIYFASENGLSTCFVGTAGKQGIMFLNEVALGKQYTVLQCVNYTSAPKGYDSVIAQGNTEPDPKQYGKLRFGKHDVSVPQSKPIDNPAGKKSIFGQSEYLVYKESQARIRYLLLMEMIPSL